MKDTLKENNIETVEFYAVATTDTSFKYMLSPSIGDNKILISFLNCFIPDFNNDEIEEVKEISGSVPVLKVGGNSQKMMDLHVVSKKGLHYIVEMQAKRHSMFDERGLFYACSAYSQQLNALDLLRKKWFTQLKPVIAFACFGL